MLSVVFTGANYLAQYTIYKCLTYYRDFLKSNDLVGLKSGEKTVIPWPGIEPGPRRWERRILTTRPPGSDVLCICENSGFVMQTK